MKKIRLGALLLALVLLLCAPAQAASGSLRVVLKDNGGAPAEGVAVTLYCASAPEFSGAGISPEDLGRERDAAKNARTLAAYAAEQRLAGTEGVTDGKGVLRFDGLEEGVYLVVCAAGQELTFPAFLVSIPLRVGGSTRYDVTSRPKAELAEPTPEPGPEPEPIPADPGVPPEPAPEEPMDPTDEGELPQTGQDPLPVILLAGGALALFLLGIWEHARRRVRLLFALALALTLGAGTVLWSYRSEDRLAGQTSQALLVELELRWSVPAVSPPETEPEGTQGTETASDGAVELGGYSLLGMLRIPEAKLELPVMSEWSYPLLAAAPCRYSGSLAGGDLVILGHSYRTHFRCLRTIQPGAAVELTDAGGEIHRYRVAAVETVRGSDSAALASDWPLTLFTCTADRRHRVLVRCENA